MIKIWNDRSKQWLEPMSITFGPNREVSRVTACLPNADPLADGWFDIGREELSQIAIVGEVNHNAELLPKK